MARYLRLFLALARYSLTRELSFRGNFLMKITVEVLWLGILLLFYRTVFARTSVVASWTEAQYLFFVGCYFALEGLVEMLFMENCNQFSELVRSGDLDLYLVKPIDEQFLVTLRDIDWSTIAGPVMGTAVMVLALAEMGWPVDAVKAAGFAILFAAGLAIAYSFLVLLMSTAVWFTRNQSLYELWWLFMSLMRYPREIFTGKWITPLAWVFTFLIPVLLVVNIPAGIMVKGLTDPWLIGFMVACAAIMVYASRRFFQRALRMYRSASS